MVYADYAHYRDAYHGGMSEADFARLSRAASAYLDSLTFGRIAAGQAEAVMEQVRDACCGVADAFLRNEQGGCILSESNDGISVTYAATAKSDARRLYEAAALYLGGTGLLYRGVG